MATFSERLTDLMLEKEIKSHELAAAIGVNTSTVNDWRRGKFQVFLSNVLKLADFFDCSLEYLMGRSETEIDYDPQPCPFFYDRLIAVMTEKGFSTYRMRKESPAKGAHLNKWKQGTDPLVPTLIAVADFLDVTLDYLVGRDCS